MIYYYIVYVSAKTSLNCIHTVCYLYIHNTAAPTITGRSNTSFIVNWITSDPNYTYTVILTNLNTGVMNNFTVPVNTNSYNVIGLNGIDNYNVSIRANNSERINTSDPITVYGKNSVFAIANQFPLD